MTDPLRPDQRTKAAIDDAARLIRRALRRCENITQGREAAEALTVIEQLAREGLIRLEIQGENDNDK